MQQLKQYASMAFGFLLLGGLGWLAYWLVTSIWAALVTADSKLA